MDTVFSHMTRKGQLLFCIMLTIFGVIFVGGTQYTISVSYTEKIMSWDTLMEYAFPWLIISMLSSIPFLLYITFRCTRVVWK